ncbi:MAG: phage holin family protein [Rhodocyclaceae bacterium]|nr:phage holin family protein [Rhodocyclaceae bacterium]
MSDSPQGLLPSSRRLLAAVVAILRTRLEILATELEEEKLRLSAIAMLGAFAAFFLSFGLIFLVLYLTVLFWDSRLLVLGGATLLFFALGVAALLRVAGEIRRKSGLFSGSLSELRRDWEALRKAEDEAR